MTLNYTLKFSRKAKKIRLTVKHNGEIILTVPKRASVQVARRFLNSKTNWILNKLEFFKKFPQVKRSKPSKHEYLKQKKMAQALALQKVTYWNKIYNFKIGRISIRNQTTRWGSCSKKGNLNFNFKIVFLPEALVDYLVVHELCHLQEFNHSRKFWMLVAKTIPDFKLKKQALARWEKPENPAII